MRVVTPFGFGSLMPLDTAELGGERRRVRLEKPFLGQMDMVLNRVSESFAFGRIAVIRVLNVSGVGYLSNLQFASEDSGRDMLRAVTPPDETTFALDLEAGTFRLNRELGLAAQDYLEIQPWLDRWSIERGRPFEKREEAIDAFGNARQACAGTSGGILTPVLLDIQNQKVLWFYLAIAPPQGVIFEKKWI